ncbi:hypothetical protein KVR01_013686 [Diaporthe batatas]|uniref:uncharacterized protein n=1 Tax=Diaporthe batatas TaxID=748121 RepID=UPI001D036427|nr:uncharacterized protein KVR01_013686 [Diaporthe batatas]KAG8156452.1 hypothetical protein KVR01_013686 [Diaporthe batatas]
MPRVTMYGPERLGCILFSVSNLEEHEVPTGPIESSGGVHALRISGELFLGITRRRNNLPLDMWDHQRSGGILSDGMTRALWIIHHENIRGWIGRRHFDVIFSRQHFASSNAERMDSFARWRDAVLREWSAYLTIGSDRLTQLIRPERLVPGWETELMSALR